MIVSPRHFAQGGRIRPQPGRIPALAGAQRLRVQFTPFQLLLPAEQAARGRAGKQASPAVDQQRALAALLQRIRQFGKPFGAVKKTVRTGWRQASAASPQTGRLIGRIIEGKFKNLNFPSIIRQGLIVIDPKPCAAYRPIRHDGPGA